MQERVTVRDGRNMAAEPEIWTVNQTYQEGLETITRNLLGSGAFGISNHVYVEVDRFEREWLDFHEGMTLKELFQELLCRIDDPHINIYPTNWV